MGAAPERLTKEHDEVVNVHEEEQIQVRRRPRVVVTGFGPFGSHKINASWASVRQLPNFPDLLAVCDLHLYEVPVCYEVVQREVPKLWQAHEPDLVIHCGVSGILANSGYLDVETCAWNQGYEQRDVEGCTPEENYCSDAATSSLSFDQYMNQNCMSCKITTLPVANICRELNANRDSHQNIRFRESSDAGRYLCEFIFRTSLNLCQDRALFIHVPPLSTPYSADDIAAAIKDVILRCLSHVLSSSSCTTTSSPNSRIPNTVVDADDIVAEHARPLTDELNNDTIYVTSPRTPPQPVDDIYEQHHNDDDDFCDEVQAQ